MDLILIIGGFIVGFWISGRLSKSSQETQAGQLASTIAAERSNYLVVLYRELSNYLFEHGPDRFLKLIKKAKKAQERINQKSKKACEKEYTALCEKYPFFKDFDLVASRAHVLYRDSLSSHDIVEVEDHLSDLVCFQALRRKVDQAADLADPLVHDSDVEHLKKHVTEFKDGAFKKRIDIAIERMRKRKGGLRVKKLDTPVFSVSYVAHFAETRYGIHFKDTDEYGLWGRYVHDDGRASFSYYRSDPTFTEEKLLHSI